MSAAPTPLGFQNSLSQPNRLKLALAWPLNLPRDPMLVSATAGAVYLITGELPWQVGWQEGLRGYAIGAVLYWASLMALKEEAEVQYMASHMPNWIKSALGF